MDTEDIPATPNIVNLMGVRLHDQLGLTSLQCLVMHGSWKQEAHDIWNYMILLLIQ